MNQLEVFKALANESRLQILFWLKDPKQYFTHQEPVDMVEVGVCVGQIQLKLGVTQSTASQYLSVLQKADGDCYTNWQMDLLPSQRGNYCRVSKVGRN